MTTSRERSILELIREADPEWDSDQRKRPVVFRFSNGREFRENPAGPYAPYTEE